VPNIDFAPELSEARQLLLADAQTSGGLLIAIAPERHQALIDELRARGTLAAATIGEVCTVPSPAHITVRA
jgi:selenide,water dikinase